LAFACAIAVPVAAVEPGEKAMVENATAVDQALWVHPIKQISGSVKRCYYANCVVGIAVKSDEACPDPVPSTGRRSLPEK
jgi:hypothetical protein